MTEQKLRDRLQAGDVLLGMGITYRDPGIIECVCRDWDFVWIDCQHGYWTTESAASAQRTADGIGVPSVLRVPSRDPDGMGPYADMAPASIMVPMVDTPDQAASVVKALRFPPLGNRSFGGRRVVDWYGRDFYKNNQPAIIVQIETVEAIRNARAISETPGVDALFFGADDVRLSMGLDIGTALADCDPLRDGLNHMAQAAREAGKYSGCVAVDSETLEIALNAGCQIIATGNDAMLLRHRSAELTKQMRPVVDRK